MLEVSLNPEHNRANPCTLPSLVGGSPLYDPQAPGWFRVSYKDQMPTDEHGIPQMEVLQAERWCRDASGGTFDACYENAAYPNCYTPPASR